MTTDTKKTKIVKGERYTTAAGMLVTVNRVKGLLSYVTDSNGAQFSILSKNLTPAPVAPQPAPEAKPAALAEQIEWSAYLPEMGRINSEHTARLNSIEREIAKHMEAIELLKAEAGRVVAEHDREVKCEWSAQEITKAKELAAALKK